MTARSLTREAAQPAVRRIRRNGLLQLGWFHFWLLSCIMAGMLGLAVVVFIVSL
jgi:hypothetical protein